jgi:hypothetical protein
MKQRLGALLCILLGAVLIGTGLTTSSAGDVGATAVGCGTVQVGQVNLCPTEQITFTKTVLGTDPSPPANWSVHITSTCLDPATSLPVNETISVPSGGATNTSDLFIYTTTAHTTLCSYSYVEDPLPSNCTAAYVPASPQELSLRIGLTVAVTNTCNAPSTSTAPPSSSSASTPPPTTVTDTTVAPTPSESSTAAPISNTGPHEQLRASVWIGIALCVLGLVLLLAGRRTGRRAL